MTIAPARIAVAASFMAISIVGAAFVFTYWASESISGAAGRSILFIVIMASVHLAGYLLYVQQALPTRAESTPLARASFEFSPQYWSAIKDAIILSLLFGVPSALLLDGGRVFGFFKVALIGHLSGILMTMGRRPMSPTSADILFIRWGVLLLFLATGVIAPFIWVGDRRESPKRIATTLGLKRGAK
jgi:hypothetical protein